MKQYKKLLALLLVPAMALCLSGCVINIAGHEVRINEPEEEAVDNKRYAEAVDLPMSLPDEMDKTQTFGYYWPGDGNLYVAFNGVRNRDIPYFYVTEEGKLVVYVSAARDLETGYEHFKLALWKKVEGGTQYVENTTYYIASDEKTYTITFTGLEPGVAYRLAMSYDSGSAYLYGSMAIGGISQWA